MHISEKGDNSLNILIYTFGNHQMGMGHVYRMSYLGIFLRKMGHDIHFFIPDWEEGITKIFQDGWQQIPIPVNQFENEIYYKDKLKDLKFDCIIVDALNVSEPIMKIFRKKTDLLISFDNIGNGRFFADILINILYKRLPPLPAPKLEINDYRYIIISNEFGEIHQKEKVILKTVQKILITQGGSDTYGIVPQLIDAIDTTNINSEYFVFIKINIYHCYFQLKSNNDRDWPWHTVLVHASDVGSNTLYYGRSLSKLLLIHSKCATNRVTCRGT